MSDKFVKIGGKTDNNTAVPVGITDDGKIKNSRYWGVDVSIMYSDVISSAVRTTGIDVSNGGLISLRAGNATDTPIKATLLFDTSESDDRWMKDVNGNYITFEIPTGESIITADDVPALNYLRFVRLRLEAVQAPSDPTKTVTILVYAKR